MATFLGAVAFVVLILFAIFFHEFGHFVTARWAKIKVSRFFVGFGPTIWSFRRGRLETVPGPDGTPVTRPETEYGIKALPLGGFVKVIGMSPFEEVPPEDEPRSFDAAPIWKRAIVLVAGSVTHFVTAFLVLFLVFAVIGVPDPDQRTTTISDIQPEIAGERSPAAAAGLRPGDRIVEIDGREIDAWGDVQTAVQRSPERELAVGIVRDGERMTIHLVPVAEERDGRTIGVMGVFPQEELVRVNPLVAAGRSVQTIGGMLAAFVDVAPRAFSPDTLGLSGEGPTDERPFSIIGAGRLAAGLAAEGQVLSFLGLFVAINIFIAVFNMLPLPPLDGGHLLVLAIVKIRGKPISPRALLPVTAVVFSLLIVLTMLLVYYDIVSPIGLPAP